MRDGIADTARPWFGWDDHFQKQHFDQEFSEETIQMITEDGRDVGFIKLEEHHGFWRIDQLYLVDSARGRGLGGAVLDWVITHAKELPVRLDVLKNNPAMRLYHRKGFRVFANGGYKWLMSRSPKGPPAETIPWEGPTEAQLEALADHHQLGAPLEPLSRLGVANYVFATQEVVVRLGVGSEESWRDARTEAVAVPPVVAAIVPTPRLRVFDETGQLVPAPVTIYERVIGEPVLLAGADNAVWTEVGRALGRLHTKVCWVPDACSWLDDPDLNEDIDALLPYAGEHEARLREWVKTLPTEIPRRCLLHNDAHIGNILVHEGRFTALIDWGDSGWGDPALEFEPMPIEAAPTAVKAWREATGFDDPTLEGRILRAILIVSLLRIKTPKERRRTPPNSKLLALLEFLRSTPGRRWEQWFPR